MARLVPALLLAALLALGAVDFFIVAGQLSAPAGSAGEAETTLAAQTLPGGSNGCWVPGDLVGEANPASIHCLEP